MSLVVSCLSTQHVQTVSLQCLMHQVQWEYVQTTRQLSTMRDSIKGTGAQGTGCAACSACLHHVIVGVRIDVPNAGTKFVSVGPVIASQLRKHLQQPHATSTSAYKAVNCLHACHSNYPSSTESKYLKLSLSSFSLARAAKSMKMIAFNLLAVACTLWRSALRARLFSKHCSAFLEGSNRRKGGKCEWPTCGRHECFWLDHVMIFQADGWHMAGRPASLPRVSVHDDITPASEQPHGMT